MKKRSVLNYTKRTLAFLLAMIMTFSVVDSAAVTAFAQTAGDVTITEESEVIEESTVSEPEETTVSSSEEAMTESIIEDSTVETEAETETVLNESSEATEEAPVISPVETEMAAPEALAADEATYTGEVSEDGTTLTISENGVVAAGQTFDDTTIISIMKTRANASERYSTVVVEYNAITDVISQNLWNAFVGIGANTIVVCFDGGSEPDERWSFYSPSSSSMGDSSLAVDVFIREDGNIGFSREYTDYSCSGGALLELCLDDFEAQEQWYEAFKAAYGEESIGYIEIRDEDNNERSSEYGATYHYSEDACVLAINLSDTYGSTEFSLHKPYTGFERTEDDGKTVFVIDEWAMPSNRNINQHGLSILEANSNTYDIIEFNYRPNFEDKCTGYVNMDVWNTACSMLNEGTQDCPSQIRVNFSGGATEPDENWCIDNPITISDSNVFLETYLTPSEDGNSATFELESNGIYKVAGSNASVNFNVDENGRKELYDSFVNAYGTKSMRLEFHDEDGNLAEADDLGADYDYGTNNDGNYINVSIYGVTKLNVYSPYSVVERVYRGDYNEHEQEDGYIHQELFLHPGEMDKTSFTAEDVTKILSNYAEKSFDNIVIATVSEDMTGSVSASVINAALPYLKEATEDRYPNLNLAFKHPTNESGIDWNLVAPQEQTEDQTLSAKLSIVDDSAVLTLGEHSLAAENININIYRNNEKDADGVAVFKSVFGETPTRLSVSTTDVPANFDMNDYETWIYIDNVSELRANVSYELNHYIYKGHINTWDDGRRELWIGFGDAGVEKFTEEQLNTILSYYNKEQDNIQFVYIEQPSDIGDCIIYKSVADKAASLITPDDDGYCEIKFGFRNPHTDQCVEWQLGGNPDEIVQTADQIVNANLFVSEATEENEDALYVSVSGQELVAPEVRVLFFTNRENENETADEFIIGLFGNKELQLETEGGETPGWYTIDDWNINIGFGDPRALTAGKSYKIIEKAYRGNVWEDTDEEGNVFWRTLYLNSNDLGKKTFDVASFKEAISYWAENDVRFNQIQIEQAKTSNNIINKDILNAARELLIDPNDQDNRLSFIFCDCVEEEWEDGECIQEYVKSDLEWGIAGPGVATKNINANATVKSVGNGGSGVSVVLPANTYNAKYINVEYYMSPNASMYTDVLYPNFEHANPWAEDMYANELVVLEKAKTLNENVHARYGLNEDGMVAFILSNVADWTAGIDNRIIEPYYEKAYAVVGKFVPISIYGYNPNDPEDPNTPPDNSDEEWNNPHAIKKINNFTLLTSTLGTIETDETSGYSCFVASVPDRTAYVLTNYTSVSGEACLEVLGYQTAVGVLGLSFADKDENGEITIEWDPTWDLENECKNDGFLQVNIKPASIQDMINPQGFEWYIDGTLASGATVSENSVSGNSIALNKYEWYYTYWDQEAGEEVEGMQMRPDGSFDITGYGKTTVTVRVGQEEDTCVINVIEPVRVPEYCEMYAVPAVDKTLNDIDLDARMRDRLNEIEEGRGDYEGEFTWANPATSLTSYANMDWVDFPAYYTVEGREPVKVMIHLELIRVTDIVLFDAVPAADELIIGELNGMAFPLNETINIGYQVTINLDQFDENGMTPAFATFAKYYVGNGSDGKPITFQWTDKEVKTAITKEDENGDLFNNGTIQKPQRYTATSTGKKTFTVSMLNVTGKTPVTITKGNATVTVNSKPIFSFGDDTFGEFFINDVTVDNDQEKYGNFIFTMSKENYDNAGKLKFATGDKSVLKLGAVDTDINEETNKVVITIPYNFKKFGKTILKVTASDELKSSESYEVSWVDYAPKVSNAVYTIDKAFASDLEADTAYADMSLNIALHHDTIATGEVTIKEADLQNIFDLEYGRIEDANYQIKLNNISNQKTGTYKLTLQIPYQVNGEEEARKCEQTIKVKVKQTKVNTSVKQTSKINTFYVPSSEEPCAEITINTGKYELLDANIVNAESDFHLERADGNSFHVFLDYGIDIADYADANKTITIAYQLSDGKGGIREEEKTITLKTQYKKPSLVLSSTGTTLYPQIGASGSEFSIYNKASGETLELSGNIELVLDKNAGITVPIVDYDSEEANTPIKVGKNEYIFNSGNWWVDYRLADESNAIKATDKFIIRVQMPNWKEAIDFTYKAKVEVKEPKLALTNKTITLNAHKEVYRTQITETNVYATNYDNWVGFDLLVTGVNSASKSVLLNNLTVQYSGNSISFRITDLGEGNTKLTPGNYKFKVYANGKPLSTVLTLKIVEKPGVNSIKVTKKGSIDVLRRDTTQITMNPKLTYLSGWVDGFELQGADADLFNYYYDWETGNCVVKALHNFNYSTKTTYTVIPVYSICNNRGSYTVKGAPQTIKLTQGKPKITTWVNTNTLYGDKSIGVLIGVNAFLKNEYIDIQEVRLLNYTNDLDWCWEPMMDENQENFVDGDYEGETTMFENAGRLTINGNTPKDITKASGTYTLKFEVIYSDAAGNEKTTQFKYKLNIVR